MRRLPGILLITGVSLVVVVALLISGLRLLLPHLNSWRPALVEKIEAAAGVPVDIQEIEASWQNFGPTLDIRSLSVGLKDGGTLSVGRVTMALDIWQSLLHLRWQFRDLTFYQLQARTNTPISLGEEKGDIKPGKFSDLFLRQFDHFDLRDSTISFLTLSGQRAELTIPQLTWLNGRNRHRAEGQVSLSSFNGQHGVVQVRMDLRDDDGLLNNGTVWMQADDVDVKPWLNQWAQDNVDLATARFSLSAWMTLQDGEISGGDIWLRKGGASWQGDNQTHRLTVDNLTAHISKISGGWQAEVPATNISIDDNPWPKGRLAFAWIAGQDVGGKDRQRSDELRIRANNMRPERFEPLLPLAEKISPQLGEIWRALQPQGQVASLALDIPLQQTAKTRLQGKWQDLSWRQWKLLPGAEHFSGEISGSLENGRLVARMDDAKMPYEGVFRAPLEIRHGLATLNWRDGPQGWTLEGENIDVSAPGLWARGDFSYQQPQGEDEQPWLSILAGIRVDDAGQAWRYFPENLMGGALVDYLSGAIQGGQVDNATLVYGGNPQLFPYKHNEGQFEVLVPLRNATFAFQPDWPALQNLNLELDFINDGLWMKTDELALGGVKARNLTAIIPDYSEEKLLIDADIAGPGNAVGPYFHDTPLKDSLAATLEQLKLNGDVNARLHLDIPLDGEMTTAKGEVRLKDNTLEVVPLETTLSKLSGQFSFENGNLQSQPLQAVWFNQPVQVDFSTREGDKAYQVGVNLSGNWQPTKTGVLPGALDKAIGGSLPWKGKVDIQLPYRGSPGYSAELTGDMKTLRSDLPAPLNKSPGEALPVKVLVKGDLQGFDITGNVGSHNYFNSRWLLKQKLTLDRAMLAADSRSIPPLPETAGVELNLPEMDGARWLALFSQGAADGVSHSVEFPSRITLRTPALTLGGQRWNNLSLVSRPASSGTVVEAQGREINATLNMYDRAPWQAAIKYLYFNPSWTSPADVAGAGGVTAVQNVDFSRWPDLQLRCGECWLWGQKYGRIDADLAVKGQTLTLSDGLLDTGFARLSVAGEWVNQRGGVRTSLKGKLHGEKIDAATGFFGVNTPIQGSPFDVDYDLHWRDVPWHPQESSLNGILKAHLGKGQIAELGTGHAGQLLRLVSFDALLRKLRFDFSDTFGSGFYFDSISSTAWIKDGVLHTDNMLVDGLEADIAMKGSVDLVRRQLDMEAVVAPEISATVGVATAFAVNPIVGAAVFAASKVLGPLWSKISVLRYRISGPIDKPQINEVLRQPRVDKHQ
ncbi:AsmA2 domain-containing protein YhdP [Entomohabitans teleogrylli]|uniref:AsmA2 domain-containing protein YhdP n=1 Tax=Entomohabitans teleogrylli TaxID=1384589 RepID=UPI00073D8BE5|nr:AsmA2 domain-containing protein YhdP [Entomohabitans teleogrylli]